MEKVKNVVINKTGNKVSLVEGAIILQKQGYKGSWARLSPRQLAHMEIEDAEAKKWIEISDTEPNFTKEVKANFIFTKPAAHGSASPEEAIEKAKIKIAKPVKEKKKKETGGKVSKLSLAEATKLSQG